MYVEVDFEGKGAYRLTVAFLLVKKGYVDNSDDLPSHVNTSYKP